MLKSSQNDRVAAGKTQTNPIQAFETMRTDLFKFRLKHGNVSIFQANIK